MGYDTTIIINVEIRKEMLDDFRKLIMKRKNEDTELALSFLQDLVVADDGSLEYDDYYGRHYGDFEFAKFLAPFTGAGDLEFIGEDGERWGYHFLGDGRAQRIVYEPVLKEIIIGKEGEKNGKTALQP
jgi:hypothetical protein